MHRDGEEREGEEEEEVGVVFIAREIDAKACFGWGCGVVRVVTCGRSGLT